MTASLLKPGSGAGPEESQASPAPEESAACGYDRLGIPGAGGQLRYLTRPEFESLPLAERVRLLMAGNLQFFRQGKQVSPRDALREA